MLDFRQITLFCFGYQLLKHKMTICSENVGGHGPLDPLATPMSGVCVARLKTTVLRLFSLIMLLCAVFVCSSSVIFVWSYKVIFSEK